MPEAKPIGSMKELADALKAFCKQNPGGNPNFEAQIQAATMTCKASLDKVERESQNKGTTVVGAAQALLDFIDRQPAKTTFARLLPKE